MESDLLALKINGIKVNYLHICERKLWLFDRGITMEDKSDKVLLGSVLEDSVYHNEDRKNILLDDLIRIDIIKKDTIIEVKYSNKMKEADRAQILYYLYYLKKIGVTKKGVITYPKMRKKEEIELTQELEESIERDLEKIKTILEQDKPPLPIRKKYCSKCAYYELCFS